MEKTYSKEELIQAGFDLTKILTDLAVKDNTGRSFLHDYLHSLTSDDGIHRKQAEALQGLSDTNQQIENSTQEILNTIRSNTEKIDGISTQFDELNNKMEEIKNQRRTMTQYMNDLYDFIKKIQDFVQNIQSISEHTNLLSFNASIEAAHAGKAGAGFRVIAQEVKKLSEQTKSTSTEITRYIDDLMTRIQTVISANDKYDDFLNQIKNLTTESSNSFQRIKSDSLNSTNMMENVYQNMKSNQENIVKSLQEVENTNIEQVKNIALNETKTSITSNDTINDRLSFLQQLNKLFQYMSTHKIEDV